MSRKGFELLDTLSLHKKVLNKVLGLFYKVSQSWPIYLEKKKFELHYKVFLFKIAFFKRIFARMRQFQFKERDPTPSQLYTHCLSFCRVYKSFFLCIVRNFFIPFDKLCFKSYLLFRTMR